MENIKEIRIADMQQVSQNGALISPEVCFEQATADFICHAETDTNPQIVKMRNVPHWFYQSDERTIQPYRFKGIFEPYVGPTELAPEQLRKCRIAKDAVRQARKILTDSSAQDVKAIYKEKYERYV